MLQADYKIEKKRIAQSFSQAAASYDSYASLQRKVADKLLEDIEKDSKVQRVMDLGSGTGYCTNELHNLYPNAEIINLDIAEAMLRFASRRHKDCGLNEKSICADAEALPFLDNTFDIVISSLSIQWCQNYSKLFSELKRVLKLKGQFHISTFGPETLQEVTQAWQQVDSFVHVNRFNTDSFLLNEINNQEFAKVQLADDHMLTYYQSFEELARELKSIGARNMNAGRGNGLNGRRKLLKLKQAFELNSEKALGIPVTYQVYYLRAQT